MPQVAGSVERPPLVFLLVAVFVDLAGYGIVIPLLPFYIQAQVPGGLTVGLLASLYAAVQLVGAPVLGGLSDKVGRRPVLLACITGTSAAYLLLGLADTLTLIIVAVLLDGATGGNLAVAQAYVADSTSRDGRARGLGLIGAAFGLGLITGPAIGGFLSLYSLSAPALFAAALALSNAVFGFFVLPESLPPGRRGRTPLAALNPVSQLSAVLRIPGVRAVLLVVFLLNLSFAGLISNFPLFSEARFGWEPASNAFFYAFVGLCAVVTQALIVGWLGERIGERRMVALGLALATVGLGLLAAAPTGWSLYPVTGLLAAGIGVAIPALAAMISGLAPGEGQGRVMGGQQAILGLALVAGPGMTGLAFDGLGPAAPYWLGSFLAALALSVCLFTFFREASGISMR